jgi:hypothetical protein
MWNHGLYNQEPKTNLTKIQKRTRIEIATTPLIKKPKLNLGPIFEIKRIQNQFGIDLLKNNVRN